MVVVMAVLGIIALVVLPSFVPPQPDAGDEVTGPLVTVLHAAQRAAADSGRTVYLTIDPASAQYYARMAGSGTALAAGTIELLPGVSLAADSIRAQFIFSPGGTATGDSLRIGGRGHVAIVSVNPWTGDADVHPW
jgi:type II secretory pathway pseudopilin PulG